MIDHHTYQIRIKDNEYVKGCPGSKIKTAKEGCGGLKNFQSAGTALKYADGYYLREQEPELVKVHWRLEEMDYMQAPDERVGYAVRFQDPTFNDGEGIANLIYKMKKNSKSDLPSANRVIGFQRGFIKGNEKGLIPMRQLQEWTRVYKDKRKAERLKDRAIDLLSGPGNLKQRVYFWTDKSLNDEIIDNWQDYEFDLVKVVIKTVTTLDKDIIQELS